MEEFTLLKIPKIIIMLVANNAESLPKAGVKYEQLLKQLHDFHLYLAPLNSLKHTQDARNSLDDIWSPYIEIGGEIVRGRYVSMSERVKMQDMIIEIVRDLIIVRAKENIKEVKETLKQSGFGLFRKDVFSTNHNLEFELHLAANCAFMLQDYEEAIVLYSKLHDRAKKVVHTQTQVEALQPLHARTLQRTPRPLPFLLQPR